MLPLHVDGRYIKDSTGKIIQLTGTTVAHTAWKSPDLPYWDTRVDPIPMAEAMKEHGANYVRICINREYWIDPAQPNYKLKIDEYVKEFTDRGIYCTVGLMSHELVEGMKETWKDFLVELALRYKNNKGVYGIYIYNEPQINNDEWRIWVREGVNALKQANPDIIPLVHASTGYPRTIEIDYWLDKPELHQVQWVYHNYFWQYGYYGRADFFMSYENGDYELAKQQMETEYYNSYFKIAVDNNICVQNEEFGFGYTPDKVLGDMGYTPAFPQCMRDYIELHNKYSITWNEYAWYQGGYAIADLNILNEVGEIWAQYLTPTPPIDLTDPSVIAAGGLIVVDAVLVAIYLATIFGYI